MSHSRSTPIGKLTVKTVATGLLVAALAGIALEAHAGDTTYIYDALGRVIEVDYPDGSKITYTYDAAGNRTQVVKTAGS